jgi:hypothetical protein
MNLSIIFCILALLVTPLGWARFSINGYREPVKIEAPARASQKTVMELGKGDAWKEPLSLSQRLQSTSYRFYSFGDLGFWARVYMTHPKCHHNVPYRRIGGGYRFDKWAMEFSYRGAGVWKALPLQGPSDVHTRAVFFDVRRIFAVWQPSWWLSVEPYLMGGTGMGHSSLEGTVEPAIRTRSARIAWDLSTGFLGRMTEHTSFDMGVAVIAWPQLPTGFKQTTYSSLVGYMGFYFVF